MCTFYIVTSIKELWLNKQIQLKEGDFFNMADMSLFSKKVYQTNRSKRRNRNPNTEPNQEVPVKPSSTTMVTKKQQEAVNFLLRLPDEEAKIMKAIRQIQNLRESTEAAEKFLLSLSEEKAKVREAISKIKQLPENTKSKFTKR